MSKRPEPKPTTPTRVRCAIYTRKSTQDGLEQEFNLARRPARKR